MIIILLIFFLRFHYITLIVPKKDFISVRKSIDDSLSVAYFNSEGYENGLCSYVVILLFPSCIYKVIKSFKNFVLVPKQSYICANSGHFSLTKTKSLNFPIYLNLSIWKLLSHLLLISTFADHYVSLFNTYILSYLHNYVCLIFAF